MLTKEEIKKVAVVVVLIIFVFAVSIYFFTKLISKPALLKYYSNQFKFTDEQVDKCAYYCNCSAHLGICTDECRRFIDKTKLKRYEGRLNCSRVEDF